MSVTLTIEGREDLDRCAAALLREASRFQRRISSATRKPVDRIYRTVLVGMVPAFMPSGYAPVLMTDLKVSTSVRFAGPHPGVTAIVSAPTGGPRGRAVKALELGQLRHPDIRDQGKPRPQWRWHAQRIRRGFASVPLKATQRQIVSEIDDELAAVVRGVERS